MSFPPSLQPSIAGTNTPYGRPVSTEEMDSTFAHIADQAETAWRETPLSTSSYRYDSTTTASTIAGTASTAASTVHTAASTISEGINWSAWRAQQLDAGVPRRHITEAERALRDSQTVVRISVPGDTLRVVTRDHCLFLDDLQIVSIPDGLANIRGGIIKNCPNLQGELPLRVSDSIIIENCPRVTGVRYAGFYALY